MAASVGVDHDVVAEEFEGRGKGRDGDGAAQERLDDDLMRLRPHIIEGIAHLGDLVLEHLQRDLAASGKGSSLLGVLVVAVDGEVGQVHEGILDEHRLEAELLCA